MATYIPEALNDPTAYFQAKLYSGNGAAIGAGGNSITFGGETNLAPGMLWIKRRDSVAEQNLLDSVRGAQIRYYPDDAYAEDTGVTESVNAFTSDGFNLGNSGGVNASGGTYVAWCWKAGGSSSSNEAGSINTTATSVDTTSGFSISTYTGNDTAGATIGHGLGAVPHFIIIKCRNAAQSWPVYHHKNTAAPETDHLILDTAAATVDAADRWNDTAPTSTLITLGDNDQVNGGQTYVAYAWTSIQGFSKFGAYKGNGDADGPFVFTGFRPAFILNRDTYNEAQWMIMDNKRSGYNPTNNRLYADTTSAEEGAVDRFDILSNGFKVRTADADTNLSGDIFAYMAFAEAPFVNSNGVPCTAR